LSIFIIPILPPLYLLTLYPNLFSSLNTLHFTMFTKYPLVALIPFYIAAVNAANDWSVPCTSGICEWDTKDGDTSGNIIVVRLFASWTSRPFTSITQSRPLQLLHCPISHLLQGGIFWIATQPLSIHRPFASFANQQMGTRQVVMRSMKAARRTPSSVCPTLVGVVPLLALSESGTPRIKAFQMRHARNSESVHQHLPGR